MRKFYNANNLDVQEVYQKLLSQLPFMKGEMAPDQLMRNMLVDVDSHYLKQGSLKVLKSMMMSSFRNPLQNREQFNAMVKTDQLDDHSLRQLLSTVEKKIMAAPEEILQLIGRSLSALRFISSRSREIFLLFFLETLNFARASSGESEEYFYNKLNGWNPYIEHGKPITPLQCFKAVESAIEHNTSTPWQNYFIPFISVELTH